VNSTNMVSHEFVASNTPAPFASHNSAAAQRTSM
jgi:hypothetical protein